MSRAVASLQLRPLVIVRRHAESTFSACPAFAPQLIAYANDGETALDELVDFLGDYFAQLPSDALQKFVIAEDATVRRVSVVLPREDLPRRDRIRTPLELPVIEVSGPGRAKWVLLPTLGQVTYVAEASSQLLEETVQKEVLRLAAASNLNGASFLDLFPPITFELSRPMVDVELEKGEAVGARARERREAERLLALIGRKLGTAAHSVQARSLGELRALLESPERASVVLVGPEGAGKSAWLRAAVALGSRPIFATSGAELVAGQSGLGQLEERVEAVVKAVVLLDAMLYFENLEDLFAGSTGGYEDIATLLRRHLQDGKVRVVGELSVEAYDRLSQRHVGVFSYLQRFSVEPLTREQTLAILAARSNARQRAGARGMSHAAQAQVLALTERYEPYRVLPGKAVALFDELFARATQEPGAAAPPELTPDDVLWAFAHKSGIPQFLLRDERSLRLTEVERFFQQYVIGQEHAVRRVAETLCSIKAGLQPTGKPLATLLFLGPTGVGKTELSKALARFLFGSPERMARFDMSEFTDVYAADRLIRGSERADGVLTRRVREQPFGVVLLDEIEKAHRSVFDLLLQVTGEGRLSDARGRPAYFHNTIIILTSNLGARHRRSSVGFGDGGVSDDASYYLGQVEQHFRPEFVGRLDGIVSFANLDQAQIRRVAQMSIERIGLRAGLSGRGSTLRISEAALETLAREGFSPDYGARGLRRYLEQALVAPLSSLISELGGQASGALILVQRDDEPAPEEAFRIELTGFTRVQTPPVVLGRLVLSAALAKRREREQNDSGVERVSRRRRAMRRWLTLSQLSDARERHAEITVQFAQGKLGRISNTTLVELSREQHALKELLEPLDRELQNIETVEGLLLGALDETPPDLESEAEAGFARFKEQLLTALLRLSGEDALTLAVHELDDRHVLHELLLPLLSFAVHQKWEVTLHFDRVPRTADSGWPSLEQRRWGPPIPGQQYLSAVPAVRPADAVLLSVRGPGAGALLSFYLGRLRYQQQNSFGELWARHVLARYELRDSDWQSERLATAVNREVGRRQNVVFEFLDASGVQPELAPKELFERWAALIFDRALVRARAGEPFAAGE